ncbi:MAG: ParB/RepB/Spo0J family partition protein [Desulfobacterales bacterium]|nr:ParB/RepB/Spo0J family partition protein [Desulfobacterales bacterium]
MMQKETVEKRPVSGSKKRKKIVLGRGLDSLIPYVEPIEETPREYFQCRIEQIRPNQYQPRVVFSDEELDELCVSIKKQGIIQPLLVRKAKSGYELISGERRLRAAKMAGLEHVPVVVTKTTDVNMLVMAIVENTQREDLNPLEESEAYHLLMTKFDLTQEQVAGCVGKSRSSIANLLRMRKLPEQIKETILDGTLSMGHAIVLLGADTPAQQMEAWNIAVEEGLSVRKTEMLIKRLKTEKKGKKKGRNSEEAYFSNLADNLSRRLGATVHIKQHGQKKGKVEIEFQSKGELDRLIKFLTREK